MAGIGYRCDHSGMRSCGWQKRVDKTADKWIRREQKRDPEGWARREKAAEEARKAVKT